ncbi:MAG: hypothetical protein HY240_04505 [Actinobacteria bacterium]|nr:hypothetical protein [Actinomycetota bacterium]
MRFAVGFLILGTVILAIGLLHRFLVRIDPLAEITNPRFAAASAAMRRARRVWIAAGLVLVLAGLFLRSQFSA